MKLVKPDLILSCLLGALALLCTLPAAAAVDTGFNAGAGIGYYRLNGEDFLPGPDDDIEDEQVSWNGFVGYQMTEVLGLEAAYVDFGEVDDDQHRLEADGIATSLLVNIPIFERIAPYGKVGALFWDAEGRRRVARGNADGEDAFAGVGTRFELTDAVDLRVEYDRYALDDTDVDQLGANLQYNF